MKKSQDIFRTIAKVTNKSGDVTTDKIGAIDKNESFWFGIGNRSRILKKDFGKPISAIACNSKITMLIYSSTSREVEKDKKVLVRRIAESVSNNPKSTADLMSNTLNMCRDNKLL